MMMMMMMMMESHEPIIRITNMSKVFIMHHDS